MIEVLKINEWLNKPKFTKENKDDWFVAGCVGYFFNKKYYHKDFKQEQLQVLQVVVNKRGYGVTSSGKYISEDSWFIIHPNPNKNK